LEVAGFNQSTEGKYGLLQIVAALEQVTTVKSCHLPFTLLALIALIIASGCSGNTDVVRLPVSGTVALSNGEKLSGSITFVPATGHTGPAATTLLGDGHYQFDRTNGPTAGPHQLIVKKLPSKSVLLESRGGKKPAESVGAAPLQRKTQWTLLVDFAENGPYQRDFTLGP
jgi:hypothetical protein